MEGDLIIVGGGIHGLMLAKESLKRGFHPILLEKDKIAHATSKNSLQIIHGGLRYLQTLDFPRYFESVQESEYFLSNYPSYIQPLPCLFPIYNRGLHRKGLFQIGLQLDRFLSNRKQNKILSPDEACHLCPFVKSEGLKGAAFWEDATIVDLKGLIQKIRDEVKDSILEGVEVVDLMCKDGSVQGVRDQNGREYFAPVVINATGPWSRLFAKKVDRDLPQLFHPSLAFNIVFNRPSISRCAVAIVGKQATYFSKDLGGLFFVGTYHLPWEGSVEHPQPSEETIENFLNELNEAMPLQLKKNEIQTIYSGLLPVKKKGTTFLSDREQIIDHAEIGGAKGFFSISGVKFTTARKVAEKALRQIL